MIAAAILVGAVAIATGILRPSMVLAQTEETTTTSTSSTTSTTLTSNPCAWEWSGQQEAEPQPCQDDEDPTFMNRQEMLLGVALIVFASFASLVGSWARR